MSRYVTIPFPRFLFISIIVLNVLMCTADISTTSTNHTKTSTTQLNRLQPSNLKNGFKFFNYDYNEEKGIDSVVEQQQSQSHRTANRRKRRRRRRKHLWNKIKIWDHKDDSVQIDSDNALVTEDSTISTTSSNTTTNFVQEDGTIEFPLRINCGELNSGFVDKNNNWWKKDVYYSTGVRITKRDDLPIIFNDDNQVGSNYTEIYYNVRRAANTDIPILYDVPVPQNAYYTIAMHFIEFTYSVSGKRIFNLYVENELVPRGQFVDIIQRSGGPYIPYILRRRAYVSDGILSIRIQSTNNTNATIAGIEIIQHPNTPSTPIPKPLTVPVYVPLSPTNIKAGDGISSFSLIYVPNNTVMMKITNSTVINIAKYPPSTTSTMFNIRADGNNTSSVKFLPNHNLENKAPYSYCGDRNGTYFPCPELIPSKNKITITALSYSGPLESGYIYPPKTVSFRIINETTTNFAPNVPIVSAPNVIASPVASPIAEAPTEVVFYPLLLNVGGGQYVDTSGRTWVSDTLYVTGGTPLNQSDYIDILDTEDDTIYLSERYGLFEYNFTLPVGNFDIIFHFSENFFNTTGERIFNILLNEQLVYDSVDILKLTQGKQYQAVTLETTEIISDGYLHIQFDRSPFSLPKLCGIEILLVAPHLAHAVINELSEAVDIDNDGKVTIQVDGTPSHTHASNSVLTEWIWKHDGNVIGSGEVTNVTLPIGEQTITLFVLDDEGNQAAEASIVTVRPYGYPALLSISPQQGNVTGNDLITIIGSGFNYSTSKMIIHFGNVNITGSSITKLNHKMLQLRSPFAPVGTPVPVYVTTPLGISNQLKYTYVDGDPIAFRNTLLAKIYRPTTIAFGPDEKLYVGTADGVLHKMTLDSKFSVVEHITTTIIQNIETETDHARSIFGITFDPMDVSSTPSVYVSHSLTFHGSPDSSSPTATNGKISRIYGTNLDQIEDIISGLPVSDHDHAVNGIEFGDYGELYIQVGGNTNAGVIGSLSASHVQKDNVLSSSTVVAYLADPNFDGEIIYDTDDDGNIVSGVGIEIFAYGLRNSFDLVLHSNGYLYSTDNGADVGYGDRSIGCNYGEELPETAQWDKINLLQYGKYYGHANRKRGVDMNDPRQCIFYDMTHESDENYTAPIVLVPSSANGIIEFQTNHFNGQLRGNLIYSKYKEGLYRVILTEDGTNVIPQTNPPIYLTGNHGLSLTQAPDGRLVDVRYNRHTITSYTPIETNTNTNINVPTIKGVYPRRGPITGGSNLNIYGIQFTGSNNTSMVVRMGDNVCPIVSVTDTKIICTIPSFTATASTTTTSSSSINKTGSTNTTVDITVVATISSSGEEYTSIFQHGYRYITGGIL